MTVILVLILAAVVGLLVGLAQTVRTDGRGTRPTPRSSHPEETGSWIDQELAR